MPDPGGRPGALSRLIVGTAGVGMLYGLPHRGEAPTPPARTTAIALLRAAQKAGVGGFDTAPAYSEAEALLGAALGEAGVVWTKLDHRLGPGPDLGQQALASLEGSLERLRRPSVEVLQWHNWTVSLATEPSFRRCWSRFARDRRVARLGATTYGSVDAVAAVESGLFELVQVEWNLLNQRVVETIAPSARPRGVRIAVRSVLLQGILTPKGEALPPNLEGLAGPRGRAAHIAAELGLPLQALAVRAALDHPDVDYVLVGIDRPEQLEEALAVTRGSPLPTEVWSRLRELEPEDATLADPRHWPQG